MHSVHDQLSTDIQAYVLSYLVEGQKIDNDKSAQF